MRDYKDMLKADMYDEFVKAAKAFGDDPSASNWTKLVKIMYIHQGVSMGGCIREHDIDNVIKTVPIAQWEDVLYKLVDPKGTLHA